MLNEKLKHVSVEVTRRCNARCGHCVYNDTCQMDGLPMKTLLAFFYNNKDYFSRAVFTGGEPFLRKDLHKMTDTLHDLGKEVAIISNGTFTEKQLEAVKPDEVKLSVDFPDDRHSQWRNIPRLFDHLTETAIPALKKTNTPYEILCTVTNRNIRDLDGMIDLADRLDTSVCFNRYVPKKIDDKLALNQQQMMELFDHMRDNGGIYAGGLGCMINGGKAQCTAGLDKLHVTNEGRITMCMFHLKPYGKINERLRKVHNRTMDARATLAENAIKCCGNCEHFDKNCWGDCLAVAELYESPKGQCWQNGK